MNLKEQRIPSDYYSIFVTKRIANWSEYYQPCCSLRFHTSHPLLLQMPGLNPKAPTFLCRLRRCHTMVLFLPVSS